MGAGGAGGDGAAGRIRIDGALDGTPMASPPAKQASTALSDFPPPAP